jgi:hypothetical protein
LHPLKKPSLQHAGKYSDNEDGTPRNEATDVDETMSATYETETRTHGGPVREVAREQDAGEAVRADQTTAPSEAPVVNMATLWFGTPNGESSNAESNINGAPNSHGESNTNGGPNRSGTT